MTECFTCNRRLSAADPRGKTAFRGQPVRICMFCRGRYAFPIEQAAAYGTRFRFVLKSEIPGPPVFGDRGEVSKVQTYRLFRRIFLVLLLLKERQEIRQKEVNWMVDEMTRKVLKLPDKIAAVVRQTFAVSGDDAKLADDVALQQIRDLLEDIDPAIMHRKKKKRLT